MLTCTVCSRPTCRPRRGHCPACYRRLARGHAVSRPCGVCGVADARVLRRHRLKEGLVVLCANHAAIAGRREVTLTELRGECCPPGDRRGGSERRRDDRRHTTRRTKRQTTGSNGERRRKTERRLERVAVGTS